MKMIEKMDELTAKLANWQIIRALRRGLLYLMPFVLIGSVVLALLNLPIPAYQLFMLRIFGEGWQEFGLLIYESTLQVMSILALITVSHAIATEKELIKSGEVSTAVIQAVALVAFLIVTKNSDSIIISAQSAGSSGMFKAIIVSVLACNLFCFFYKLRDRIQPEDLVNYNGSALIRTAFRTVIPALLTIFFFCAVKILLNITEVKQIQETFLNVISTTWLTGHNYGSALIIILITHVLWFLGIHGGNVIMDAMSVDAISGATAAVLSVDTTAILTKEFFDTYVYLGGAGATVGLLFALLAAGEKGSEKRIATVSILPGIFNINEIMIYGLPILFNPYFLVPFLLSPVILSFVSWGAVCIGWVPPVIHTVKWTTPIFLSGYLGTDSLAGVALQIVNLFLSTLIYLPFVRLQQRYHQRGRITVFKNLINEIQYVQTKQQKKLLNRHDETGSLARALVAEIKDGFRNQQNLCLEYQPKVNHKGEVMGAEALLRWTHPVYGYVSPLIILAVCEEANLTNKLGTWIINQAFEDLKCWHQKGYFVSLSVNLSPQQLQEDDSLVQTVKSCIDRTGIEPKYMELELTENATIDLSVATQDKLKQIRNLGVNLSIDDFGMGHSSLLYLCDLYANIVKLDVSLVRTITSDKHRQQIVQSILSLCGGNQMNVKVVAEGVETKEQVQMLHKLGCEYYQGFYFSRSLTSDKFIAFMKEHGCIQEEAAVSME